MEIHCYNCCKAVFASIMKHAHRMKKKKINNCTETWRNNTGAVHDYVTP
jgi:hypothetical protein